MRPDAWTIPALLARRRAGRRATGAPSSPTTTPITYAELDERQPRAGGAGSWPPGSARATGSACSCPTASTGPTAALAVMRVGAVLVPLSTLLRPPELLAQLRRAASPT